MSTEQWPADRTVFRKGDRVMCKPGALKKITLPDGSTKQLIADGAVASFNGGVLKLFWRREWHLIPTIDEVMEFTLGDCRNPDGNLVEPDAPDSWLTLLKVV